VIKGDQSKNILVLWAKEVAKVDEFVICKTESRLLFHGGVGVVGVDVLTVFNILLGSLPVPSSGRPAPYSWLRRHAQPVDLPWEGPHWGQQRQVTQWGLPLPPLEPSRQLHSEWLSVGQPKRAQILGTRRCTL